jgi:hypothetical protein
MVPNRKSLKIKNTDERSSARRTPSFVTPEEHRLETYIGIRERVVDALDKGRDRLRQAYTTDILDADQLKLLEIEQKSHHNDLELIDREICAFEPTNDVEKKLLINTLLDIHVRLNDLDESDGIIELIRNAL